MASVAINGFSQIDNRDIVDLTPHEILVLLGIKAHYRSNPTQQELAEVIGISVSAVKRAIRSLIERGRLVLARAGRKNVGANRYLTVSGGQTDPMTGHTDPLTDDPGPISGGHTDPHMNMTTTTEQKKRKTSRLAARGEGTDVETGRLPDDDPPEDDADLGAKPTFKTCEALFKRRARQIGQTNYPIGVVLRTIKVLRDEKGLDYRQIAEVIETFFARYDVDARSADNIATLFRYRTGEILNFRRKQEQIRGDGGDDQSWKSDTTRKREAQTAQIVAMMKERYGL